MTNLLIESSDFDYIVLDGLCYSVTNNKISGFSKLKDGWNYGEGIPIEQKTIDSAVALNNDICSKGFLETDAFPVPDGSIMVTVYHGKDYLEFTIHSDKSITYAKEQNGREIAFEENLNTHNVEKLINNFREEIWLLSDSSIQSSTINEFPDIKAPHLLHPGRTVASLSWQGIA